MSGWSHDRHNVLSFSLAPFFYFNDHEKLYLLYCVNIFCQAQNVQCQAPISWTVGKTLNYCHDFDKVPFGFNISEFQIAILTFFPVFCLEQH